MTKSIDFMIKLELVENVKMRRVKGDVPLAPLMTAPLALTKESLRPRCVEPLGAATGQPTPHDNIGLDEAVTQEKVLRLFEQLQTVVRHIGREMEVEIRSIRTRDPRPSRPGFALEDGTQI